MKRLILPIFILIIFLISCKKDNSKPSWKTDILTPLAYTNLSIYDILTDSIITTNPDSSISLIYSSKLSDINIDSILQIPDTSVKFTAKLDNLELSDINLSDSISLGMIANEDYEQNGESGAIYSAVNNALNTGLPVNIDPIPQQNFSNINLSADEYFHTITISECKIKITIKNNIILPISDLVLEIRNQSNNELIVADTFNIIDTSSYVVSEKIIYNKTIESNLTGNVKFASPGIQNVIITQEDTSNVIKADISVYDIKLISAVAKFPNQDIININDNFEINSDENIQLNTVISKSGAINLKVYNTLPQIINFNFKLPSATKDGIPLTVNGQVPKAINGNQGIYQNEIDLSDYNISLKGTNNDTVNKISYQLSARIDSTGEYINLSLTDSVYLECMFNNLKPKYAQGWFGNSTINLEGVSVFDLPQELKDAYVNFKGTKLSVELQNSIGIQGNVVFNNISATNTSNSTTQTLQIPLEYNPLYIQKPIDNGEGNITPQVSNINLNSNNSNTDDIINIIPDKINYNIDLNINNNQSPPNVGEGTDFVYSDSKIEANINMEIPLDLIASGLVLTDTFDINVNTDDVKDGALFHLFSYNGFPIEAKLQLYILDKQNNTIKDSLFIQNNTVQAGIIEQASHKVIEPFRTKLDIPVSQYKMQELQNTKKLLLKVIFDTKPNGEHVKIYSNYYIKVKISADFSYSVN